MEQPKWQEKKPHQYPATFKAEAISTCENRVAQETVAEWFGITQSQVSRWLKNKASIMEDATNSHRKLFKKGEKQRSIFNCMIHCLKSFYLLALRVTLSILDGFGAKQESYKLKLTLM